MVLIGRDRACPCGAWLAVWPDETSCSHHERPTDAHAMRSSLPRRQDGASQEDLHRLPNRSRKDRDKDANGTAQGDRHG